MKGRILSVVMCVVIFTTTATIATASEGREYFIKLSSDRQALYLQDTYTNAGADDVNIFLLDTSQLNGHATAKIDDASLLHDKENSLYKMWVLASTGRYGYWSVYYVESQDLTNWNVQEVLYGISNRYDANRTHSISVLKESDTNYKMWYYVYWATHPVTHQWSCFIHYRNSSDGINWGPEQLTHNPGGYSDDETPTAVHLQVGILDRLYYSYLQGDLPGNWYYPRRMDVALDGVTESNITQLPATAGYHHRVLGATIIGNQEGDSHHRVWVNRKGDLLRYDSFDEGQNWTATNMGEYNTTNYSIVGTFYEEEAIIPAMIDIKPQSCPNPFNVKSKSVLPVAILGTEDFNVMTIDVATIRLEGVAPIRSSFEDVAAPVADANDCNCTTDGPDGFGDLTLKFKTQEVVGAIGDVNDGDVLPLILEGMLYDGTPIEGTDCILVRGKAKSLHGADINKDGVVDQRDFAVFAENWLQSSIVED